MRLDTENILNEYLEKYAPLKQVTLKGLTLDVPNTVSCLHHKDYNQLHGTKLKEVPMIPRSLLALDPHKKDQDETYQAKIQKRQELIDTVLNLRAENNFELYQSQYNEKIKEIQQQKDRMNQVQDFKAKLMDLNFQAENKRPQAEITKEPDNDEGPSFDR